MFHLISRKRLAIACAVAAVTAGGVAGTVLAGHATGARVTAATPGQTQPAPSPSPKAHGPARPRGRAGVLGALHLVKVVSLTGQTLVVAAADGTQTTYTVSSDARVVGPKRTQETLGELEPGELIVVVAPHAHPRAPEGATPASPSPQSSTGPATVVLIRDTGFKAA